MSDTRKLYNYLLSKRELDLDTLKSRIQVKMEYADYVVLLAGELGMDPVRCLEAVEELEGLGRICILLPQMEGYIEFIEVYG